MIQEFSGENAFLSNFHPAPVEFEGVVYPTVEHAFQAAKTDDPAEREKVRSATTPRGARMLGQRVTLRAGWDSKRVNVMRALVRKKFEIPELREQLLATGDQPLVEGNTWHDRFWGRCLCETHQATGSNWLGSILMGVRNEIRDSAANGASVEASEPASVG
jgi:ribA/ribD-fused uncharacterized protein